MAKHPHDGMQASTTFSKFRSHRVPKAMGCDAEGSAWFHYSDLGAAREEGRREQIATAQNPTVVHEQSLCFPLAPTSGESTRVHVQRLQLPNCLRRLLVQRDQSFGSSLSGWKAQSRRSVWVIIDAIKFQISYFSASCAAPTCND
jgi:hypothetical protein